MKPCPLPNNDLGGRVAIIDASGVKPVWKALGGRIYATEENARRVIRQHGLKGAWLLDDCGYKRWVSL